MEALRCVFLLVCTCCVYQAEGRKTFADMFPHKHAVGNKFPFPIPSIPGWGNDTTPWDDYLYPPPYPKPKQLMRHKGKPKVHLTSDSPALHGSNITFTAKLEYLPCQKEDANGDLVWDSHCEDANGQVNSGYVYNWTSWMDDYGFGKCTDVKKCNTFPDGKPFPQSNDWRRKSYVYVWHAMGQYFETNDGSSSSVTLNTTGIPLGAEVMEVMVYRKRERRKYIPLTTDSTVYFVTDKIPVAVSISQKAAVNQSDNVFFRGEDVVFQVQLHDPSGYLKTAASIDYIWTFGDGNQLVTHRDLISHSFSRVGSMRVKLLVEAAFPMECPYTTLLPTQGNSTPPPFTEVPTHVPTFKTETPQAASSTSQPLTSSSFNDTTSSAPATEPFTSISSETPEYDPSPLVGLQTRSLQRSGCFRYVYGTFQGNITIIEPKYALKSLPSTGNRIVGVSSSRVSSTDVHFLVKCLGDIPTSACTIISDPTCSLVLGIVCDDVPPVSKCEVHLTRAFSEPGTYCVNITLGGTSGLALTSTASTTITINKSQDAPVSKTSRAAEVVLSSAAVLAAVFGLIAYLVCKRYKVYRPVSRPQVGNACVHSGVRGHMVRLKDAVFCPSEENQHLLPERRPL
ncbi:protein QNR-71 [Brachionichthys hirsutus]|uniref:protein QNR-71 n=1 Tax=Brachionichthys hirsutus TaxID=412623 RepID=UPI0036052D4B